MAQITRRLATLVLCATLCAPLVAQARSCDRPANLDALQAEVVAQVNAERSARGLPALRTSGALDRAAQGLACDNADRRSTSHVSANGAELRDRLRSAGYAFRAASENTGRGFGSAAQAVGWWMDSPAHRANILMDGAQDIGVGIALSAAPESRLHWVINMGAKR
ncbi:MAG: CAP domain-containing protein [Rhodobacteraceae bacterium]|jgi:uncharacterized protein YkwD|nr:CAP domain-containing protein [Paracoccaceae bacterium]